MRSCNHHCFLVQCPIPFLTFSSNSSQSVNFVLNEIGITFVIVFCTIRLKGLEIIPLPLFEPQLILSYKEK